MTDLYACVRRVCVRDKSKGWERIAMKFSSS